MTLHRDIYWVGRQWAVTGYGIQACNQKQRSKFDIEANRLWQEGVLDSLRAEAWFNAEDFDNALDAARKYYPEPPRKAPPPKPPEKPPAPAVIKPPEPAIPSVKQACAKPAAVAEIAKPAAPIQIQAPKPAALNFNMRIAGWPAKFVRPWRIRIKR
jgi:hypothetical protein